MEQKRRIDPQQVGVAFNLHPSSGALRAVSVTLEYWPTGSQVTLLSDSPNFGLAWNTESTARLWEQAFKMLETQVTSASA